MTFPLTTTAFRTFETTALGDPALQSVLDAAAAEINRFAGAVGSTVEWFDGGQRYLHLARPVSAITSIAEVTVWDGVSITLSANDYLVFPGGLIIQRVGTGPNPRWHWWGRVVVTYTPADDDALRTMVEVDLVKLALSYAPGLVSEQIGTWTETFRSGLNANPLERDEILARLAPAPTMLVVGPSYGVGFG